MGSETEFGLTSRGRAGIHDFLFEIDKQRGPAFTSRKSGEVAEAAKKLNWWGEDLSFDETVDKRAGFADVARRLGMSGDYLSNGARFYRDCGHLEYSTPECRNPWELVAYEKAGEEIVRLCVARAAERLGSKADLLKRNADYHDSSYACHANYLLSRKLFNLLVPSFDVETLGASDFLSREQAIWTAHNISMQIFAGAGRIVPGIAWPDCFIPSQRQKFITHFAALDTTHARSIINTRDRPYADPSRFARLHVICCDSNRADWSNILKYGTSSLVLGALEDFAALENESYGYLTPANAVQSFRNLKDRNSQIETSAGIITALDMQRKILEFAANWHQKHGKPGYEWAPLLFAMWKEILDLLERDDEKLRMLLDRYIKQRVFEKGFGSSDQNSRTLKSLEHNYHLVDHNSLFGRLEKEGHVDVVVGSDDVEAAFASPPPTRASLRCRLLRFLKKRFEDGRGVVSWHSLGFTDGRRKVFISLPDPASSRAHEISEEKSSFSERLFSRKRIWG